MSWTFNPPPGWPPQPAGWVPPPGWQPDPSWPPAPAGWQFWVPAGTPPPVNPPAIVSPVTPTAQLPTEPAVPYRPGTAPLPAAGAIPPYSAPPATATTPGRPWFGRWWVLAGLVALLLIGSAAGYGGTRAALDLAADTDPAASTDPPGADEGPGAAPSPEPTEPSEPPELALPTVPPLGDEVCGQVAITMITMLAAVIDPDQAGSLEEYQQSVADARRVAASELRALAEQVSEERERAALEEFAAEVEASAQLVEDNLGDQEAFEESFDQVSEAYEDINDENC